MPLPSLAGAHVFHLIKQQLFLLEFLSQQSHSGSGESNVLDQRGIDGTDGLFRPDGGHGEQRARLFDDVTYRHCFLLLCTENIIYRWCAYIFIHVSAVLSHTVASNNASRPHRLRHRFERLRRD